MKLTCNGKILPKALFFCSRSILILGSKLALQGNKGGKKKLTTPLIFGLIPIHRGSGVKKKSFAPIFAYFGEPKLSSLSLPLSLHFYRIFPLIKKSKQGANQLSFLYLLFPFSVPKPPIHSLGSSDHKNIPLSLSLSLSLSPSPFCLWDFPWIGPFGALSLWRALRGQQNPSTLGQRRRARFKVVSLSLLCLYLQPLNRHSTSENVNGMRRKAIFYGWQ